MIIIHSNFWRNYEKEEEYFKKEGDTEGLTNILFKTEYFVK